MCSLFTWDFKLGNTALEFRLFHKPHLPRLIGFMLIRSPVKNDRIFMSSLTYNRFFRRSYKNMAPFWGNKMIWFWSWFTTGRQENRLWLKVLWYSTKSHLEKLIITKYHDEEFIKLGIAWPYTFRQRSGNICCFIFCYIYWPVLCNDQHSNNFNNQKHLLTTHN